MDTSAVDTGKANPIPSGAVLTVPEVVPIAVPQPRLLNLQILRACAASMVVAEHSVGELTFWHYPMTRYAVASDAAGGIGVISFF
jgi:peptidoglycan/LPS O-acetylase OafA/YrhL